MDNEDGRLGAILWDYRGLKMTFYPIPKTDGSYDLYDEVDEDGEPKSERVNATFDYADAVARELRRRLPESGHLVAAAVESGAIPVMGQQQGGQPQDVCDNCGGEARWTPYRIIKSGRDAGKSKRSLECTSGCKNDRGYPRTIRWQEGR